MDNKDELLPIVDVDGNVMGSITRGEAHSGTKTLHPVVHCTFSTLTVTYIYRKDPHGKMFNRANGTLRQAAT